MHLQRQQILRSPVTVTNFLFHKLTSQVFTSEDVWQQASLAKKYLQLMVSPVSTISLTKE